MREKVGGRELVDVKAGKKFEQTEGKQKIRAYVCCCPEMRDEGGGGGGDSRGNFRIADLLYCLILRISKHRSSTGQAAEQKAKARCYNKHGAVGTMVRTVFNARG